MKFFFQRISWNTVSGSFHETWNTFMKYFYFSIQHSLRMFLINKKIVFTEKRYRVKFSSIKKHLLLIKQKQKNSKIPKRIWMKPCSKTRSDKSTCANILTILFRHYLGMNATSYYWSYIDFYTLITYNYILTDTYNCDTAAGAEFISSPPEVFLNILQISQESNCARVSFLKKCKPSGRQRC